MGYFNHHRPTSSSLNSSQNQANQFENRHRQQRQEDSRRRREGRSYRPLWIMAFGFVVVVVAIISLMDFPRMAHALSTSTFGRLYCSSSLSSCSSVDDDGKDDESNKRSTQMMGDPHSTTSSSSAISIRGQGIKVVRDDIPLFEKGREDPYHPIDNPDGYLVMLIAENKLMWKEMASKIESIQVSHTLPEWVFTYGDFGGERKFKHSMTNIMKRWINSPIDPTYLRIQAGAGSILDQLSYILADTNDGVIITGPGYPAFPSDFAIYGHAKLYVAPTQAANGYVPTIEELDECYDRSSKAGNPPKIFVICQPNNPTGTIYPKEAMQMIMSWALDKKLHIISDEIYALSTLPSYNTTSAADIMFEWEQQSNSNSSELYLGDYVHIVSGLSKDWGMSGFRVGYVFSHNTELLRAMDIVGYYQGVSSYTQHVLSYVFEDDDFVDWYISENRKRLHDTYSALEEALSLIDVPLVPSQGGIFAWADFSGLLKENQTEKELWMELFDDAKVALTSGESCYGDKPGMFRIVYGWPEGGRTAMEELGRRLVRWKAQR